jgi:hypothetical protein
MIEYAAFEGDAFAPLISTNGASCSDAWSGFGVSKQQEAGPIHPWARIRAANQANPFAQPTSTGFASGFGSGSLGRGTGLGGGFGTGSSTGWAAQGSESPAFASQNNHLDRQEAGYRPASGEDDMMGEDEEMDAVDQSIGGLAQPDMATPALGLHMSYVQPNQWTGWGGQAQLAGVPSQWDRGRR